MLLSNRWKRTRLNIFCGPSISVQMIDRSVLFYVNDDHCAWWKPLDTIIPSCTVVWVDMSLLYQGNFLPNEMQIIADELNIFSKKKCEIVFKNPKGLSCLPRAWLRTLERFENKNCYKKQFQVVPINASKRPFCKALVTFLWINWVWAVAKSHSHFKYANSQ